MTGETALVTSLQVKLADVSTALHSIQAERARKKATAFIDGEIRKGRIGVKPLRDHYITRQMAELSVILCRTVCRAAASLLRLI